MHGDCCLWAIAHRHAQQLQGTKLSCLLRCLLGRHLGDREGQRTGCFQLQYVFCWGGGGGGEVVASRHFLHTFVTGALYTAKPKTHT